MGARRSLLYQALICIPLVVVWLWTTRTGSTNFTPLPVFQPVSDAPMPFARTLTIHLHVFFDSATAIATAQVEEDLLRFVNQLSHFADAHAEMRTAFMDKVCCETCAAKLDQLSAYLAPINMGLTGEQVEVFAILSNKECEKIPGENVVYARKGSIGVLSTYVVEIVRRKLGLKVDPGMELTNGFTSEELASFPSVLPARLKGFLGSQAQLFNTLMAVNSPVVSPAAHSQIEHVRSLLRPDSDYHTLLEAARQLETLMQLPTLYKEEYFQMDFKVGVYAPLFVPPIFPLVGVAYSLWTRRKRR